MTTGPPGGAAAGGPQLSGSGPQPSEGGPQLSGSGPQLSGSGPQLSGGRPQPAARPAVYLVRHGQSTWNASGLVQGQADVPLTALGKQQASQAAQRLADTGARLVCASDLRRAAETARPIAASLGVTVTLERDLRERSLGSLEGRRSADAWAEHGANWADPGWAPPGGESALDLFARARRFLRRLAPQAGRGPVIVVTHGEVAGVILALLRGEPPGQVPSHVMANGEIVAVACGPPGSACALSPRHGQAPSSDDPE